MRVLHVIPAVARRYGGPSAAVLQMCRALGEAGHDVMLATTDADGAGALDVPLGILTEIEGVKTVIYRRQWSEAFKFSRPLAKWLRTHVPDFDVVHIHALLSHACMAAAQACRHLSVPYIVRPLGTLDPWSLAQKPWRKRVLLAAGGRGALAGADAVHYTAVAEQASVEDAFETRGGFVTPLGIDEAWFAPPIPYEERAAAPFILSLSRLHPVKALDALIEAFGRVARGSWRLVIAGDGDRAYLDTLKALAGRSPAADSIEFHGWVDGADKARLLRTASVLALPSHHENFGVGLAEAMACGTPAVVSRHVMIAGEVAGAGGGWVCDNTVPALAECLARVLSDSRARLEASRAARVHAAQYAWPRVAATLTQAYERVCAAGSAGRVGRTAVTGATAPHLGHRR
jgi:glycosyltransferase involved in cell wall biosynthesis